MSDISNFQLIIIVFGSTAIWFSGFSHGKWYGIQKAEERQRQIEAYEYELQASRRNQSSR